MENRTESYTHKAAQLVQRSDPYLDRSLLSHTDPKDIKGAGFRCKRDSCRWIGHGGLNGSHNKQQ